MDTCLVSNFQHKIKGEKGDPKPDKKNKNSWLWLQKSSLFIFHMIMNWKEKRGKKREYLAI